MFFANRISTRHLCFYGDLINNLSILLLYSVSPSPLATHGSDVARLFGKCSSIISCVPGEIVQTRLRAHKNKECVHAPAFLPGHYKSLPGDGETKYMRKIVFNFMEIDFRAKFSTKSVSSISFRNRLTVLCRLSYSIVKLSCPSIP